MHWPAAEPPDQLLGLVDIIAGTQYEDQFALLAVGQVEPHLQCCAGVKVAPSGRTVVFAASRRDWPMCRCVREIPCGCR